jgi:phosphoribosylformylglycinamidine cyclo-ligase
MGKLDAVALEALVEGMAAACRENGIALIGGETAEMPGLYAEGEYDAAGFIVGEVAPDRFVDGHEVAAGDIVLGFLAVGLHTNGFSLARNIAGLSGDAEHDRALLESPLPGDPATTLAAALMAPHPSYVGQVRSLLDAGLVRGMAHITGGGLVDNVPRMIPDGLQAILDADTWTANPIFDYLVEQGSVPEEERYRVFNMGIGFVVAIRPDDVEMATALSPDAVRIGQIVAADAAGERKIWLVRGNRDIAG